MSIEMDHICENGCGDALERDITGEWVCPNPYCPTKFSEGTKEHEMAVLLSDALDEVFTLSVRVKVLKNQLEHERSKNGKV